MSIRHYLGDMVLAINSTKDKQGRCRLYSNGTYDLVSWREKIITQKC